MNMQTGIFGVEYQWNGKVNMFSIAFTDFIK